MGKVVNKKMETDADVAVAALQADKVDKVDVYTKIDINSMIGDIETLLGAL